MPQPLTLLRILWEDDRFGRISLVMNPDTCARLLSVDVPAGRTPAGEVRWQPLDDLHGADTEAAQALRDMLFELAGDVYFYTLPFRDGDDQLSLPDLG